MVDEYQDTNHSQYLIVKALSSKFENICVVGDDAQSIYSFRGANILQYFELQERLSRCQNRFSGAKLPFYAEYCERCECSHCQKQRTVQKNVFSDNEVGDKIKVFRALSDADEANFVANNIWEQHNANQRKFTDFAILYRTNSQTRALKMR